MKRIFASLIFILVSSIGFAQNYYEKNFGWDSLDIGNSICKTLDGGCIVAGFTRNHSGGLYHAYVLKLNNVGDTIWTRTYGKPAYDARAYSIQEVENGNYVFAGYIQSGPGSIYLVKLNSFGDTIWTKRFSPDGLFAFAYSVKQTFDGGYIICGNQNNNVSTPGQLLLVKTDSNGNYQWHQTFGGINGEGANDVIQTADSGYAALGFTRTTSSGDADYYLVRTNSAGNFIWSKTYGNYNQDLGYSLNETSDGGFILLGESEVISGIDSLFLIRVNSVGDTLWTKKYMGNVHCADYSLDFGINGGYILCGSKKDSLLAYPNVFLIKTDDTGNLIWSKEYGGSFGDEGNCIENSGDGYLVTGYSDCTGQGDEGFNVYVLKVNPNGDINAVNNFEKQHNNFLLFPNPTSTTLNISSNLTGNYSLKIYNLLGEVVMQQQHNFFSNENYEVNVAELPTGYYQLTLCNGAKILSKGFVKSE